jgi:RNA polymerase sigma factor (sigma-70 family)
MDHFRRKLYGDPDSLHSLDGTIDRRNRTAMNSAKADAVACDLDVLWTVGTLTGLSDSEVLGRFTSGGEGAAELAFRELVYRHGPMVMGVCRQILRRPQDAEDAFQATFLVLVRKARSIRMEDSLAPWLYGVACRTAQRARATASRYRTLDVESMAEAAGPSPGGSFEFDVRPLLHEELASLPGKYREPIVLCHLEGKSHEEAARLLSWPVGTLSGRLSRGRQILKARLERRGVAVSSAMLSARWWPGPPAAVAPSLVESTLAAAARFAAAGTISTSVQSLTQGVLRTMLLNKLKAISLGLAVVGAASGGVAWSIRASGAASPSGPPQVGQVLPAQDAEKDARPPGGTSSSTSTTAGADTSSSTSTAPGARSGTAAVGGRFPGMSLRPEPLGKNAPNLIDPRHPLGVVRSSSILVVQSPDRTAIEAMSLDAGDQAAASWQRFTIPPGVSASPLLNQDCLALHLRGKTIDHVAAFSRSTGEWKVQRLLKPAQEELTPYLLLGGVIYQVGNDVYAFSARTGTWGVLHLEGEEKPRVAPSPTDIEVLQGNRLYVFSLKHGSFSPGVEMNLKPFRREPQEAAPAR